MKNVLLTLALISAAIIPNANADEQYAHFPALPANDISTALCNIKQYNAQLSALLNTDKLSALDMVKVHELTYTLENAINYLKANLAQTSIVLEEVHKASESLDAPVIRGQGQEYLKSTALLNAATQCP